jgi:hypothetical protein
MYRPFWVGKMVILVTVLSLKRVYGSLLAAV